jgi:hypothetical protein
VFASEERGKKKKKKKKKVTNNLHGFVRSHLLKVGWVPLVASSGHTSTKDLGLRSITGLPSLLPAVSFYLNLKVLHMRCSLAQNQDKLNKNGKV